MEKPVLFFYTEPLLSVTLLEHEHHPSLNKFILVKSRITTNFGIALLRHCKMFYTGAYNPYFMAAYHLVTLVKATSLLHITIAER